ncbi:hypothetical protein RZN22_04675 [Bacillaceae bacterium S4-13-58]
MFLIVGTMIGAGYASGRELWQFFGHGSGLAIFLFALLFSICCYVILSISYQKKSTHYVPVLREIVGKNLTSIYDGMIILYLFTTTVVMLAGSGATWQAFNFSYWVGIAMIALPLVLIFTSDIKGVLSLNTIILPFLITGLLYVLFSFIVQENLSLKPIMDEQFNWIAAFPFTALNILPLIAVMGAIGNQINNKKEIWFASIGSGVILGVISYVYNTSLIQISEDIFLYEIPLFAILNHFPYEMFIVMSFLLWIAIFTTAVSGVLGLVTRFREYVHSPLWVLSFIIITIMIPLTSFGFSTLIEVLYPLYGLLNLYVLSSLLLYPILNRYHLD